MRTARLRLACIAALHGLAGAACSASEQPYPGALMVAVQTDLVAPKDVTAVGLFISSDGRPVFSDTRDTAPNGEVRFPATIAVIGDLARPGAVIKIRAVAFTSDAKVRVLRDAITTVPRGRTGVLRMPLLWVNEGSGTGTRQDVVSTASIRTLDLSLDALSNLRSTCANPAETYIDGECRDASVDPAALADYRESDVFGGGQADGTGGSCFDVKACFASAVPLVIHEGCVAALPDGWSASDPSLSLGIALQEAPSGAAASTGECLGNGICVVPLDQDGGWSMASDGAHLPPALCKRIAAGSARGVVATRACAGKTTRTPACGPASAVGADNPITPDGGAGPAGTIDFDGGPLGDATSGEDASVADATTGGTDGGSAEDATADGASADASIADAGSLDASARDAAAQDASTAFDAAAGAEFGPQVEYTIGEPGPTSLQSDGQRLYVARASSGPTTPNLLSFALSDLLANPSNPSFPRRTYFNAADVVGSAAPLYDLAYASGVPATAAGAFQGGPPWKFLTCQIQPGGPGCSATGPLAASPSLFNARAVALTPNRVYVANDSTPAVDYFDFKLGTWASFTVPTSFQVTAIHYLRQANTLIVGLASGEIYRCSDLPCSATNGAFYSLAPTPGRVLAIADDGVLMYWVADGQGVFKEDAVTPVRLVAGPLITLASTSLALDASYVYFPDDHTLRAARIDGSTVNTPLALATSPAVIASVVSTPQHVFFSAPPSYVAATCKRFLNGACN